MPGKGWANASIRDSVKTRIQELIEKEECLYGSLGDFVNDACRRLISEEEERIARIRAERERDD